MEDETSEEKSKRTKNSTNRSTYNGLSKRTKYREITEAMNIIKHELSESYSGLCCSSNHYNLNNHNQNSASDTQSKSQLDFSFNLNVNTSLINQNCAFSSDSNSCSSSISSDMSDDSDVEKNLQKQLVFWSQKHNITNFALTDLLHILKDKNPSLPVDARTLLQTPTTVDVVTCNEGSYVYFGLEKNILLRASSGIVPCNYPLIEKILDVKNVPVDQFLSVSVNVDGLPLHKSTNKSFWPLLCILDQALDKTPMVVCLYYGESKPSSANDFLRPFVEECLNLEKTGITVLGKNYVFRVSCIIADSPARSFVKCTVGHNSLHGCEKCIQEGTYLGRTVWDYKKNTILRTDAEFNKINYDDHQYLKSVLSNLDLGLISQVPLDYMHLICLGVVKKLVRLWVEKGPKKSKLSADAIEIISYRLLVISQHHFPKEFSRRPRPLKLFKFWKATEFRSFVLYLGPVVLKNVLSKEIYDHFLILHCAVYILASYLGKNVVWRNYANELLHCFVENVPLRYGRECLVYNIHNLLHLAMDVENFGCLDNFSAFPFENFMSSLKRMVRGPNYPLQQVAKRLAEQNFLVSQKCKPKKFVKKASGKITSVLLPGSNCIVGTALSDSCFLTKCNYLVIIRSIEVSLEDVGHYKLHCDVFLKKDDFYDVPLKSSKLGIYKVHDLQPGRVISLNDLCRKCLLLPSFGSKDEASFLCFPLCE